jgi:hypothetical protein
LPEALVYSARALVRLKRPTEAVDRLEKAMLLLGEIPWHRTLKAEAQLGLADALWAVGEEKPRARELGSAAEKLFVAIPRNVEAARARAWVEAHR